VLNGAFQIIWDGNDFNNNPLPNGTYYYKLTGENNLKLSNKLMIAR